MNLSDLDIAGLKKLNEDILKEIELREAEVVKKAREQVLAIAQSVGIPIHELLRGSIKLPKEKKPSSVPPRYQNPSSPAQTWTGRGRQPKWVKEWVDSGKSLEELIIK